MPLPYPGQDAVPFTTLTAQFYDETIANIEALADGSGLDADSITGVEIASYKIRRRNNTTNIIETAAIRQTGWAAGQPGAANFINISIVFPVAFANVPIVTATFGGDTAAVTSTLGAGGANINNGVAEAIALTATGFTLRIVSLGGTNWAANNTVYGLWTAEGV